MEHALHHQRQGQVDRSCRFADAALAGCHGNDVLHPRDELDSALNAMRHDLARDINAHVANSGNAFRLPATCLRMPSTRLLPDNRA